MERRVLIGVLLIVASFLIPALLPYSWGNLLGALLITSGVFLTFYDIIILGK